MAYIKVDMQRLNQLELQLNRLPTCINSVSIAVRSARSGLDWDVAREAEIDRRLYNITNELDKCRKRMQDTVLFLGSALRQYEMVETVNPGAPYASTSSATGATVAQSEYERRKGLATAIKWIVGGTLAIGSIALIIATAGAATPVLVGTISAVSGMIMTATNHLANEYVEEGTLGNTNWKDFGRDVVISGVVGFVTGAVGTVIGNAVTSMLGTTALSSGLCSANTFIRAGSKAVVGGISETASGVVSRGTGALIEGAIEGDVNPDVISSKAFDTKNMLYDAAVGGVTNAITEVRITKKDTARYNQHLKDMQDLDHLTPGMDAEDYSRFVTASEQLDQGMPDAVLQEALNYQDRSHLNDFNTDDLAIFEVKTPEITNYEWREARGYSNAPYDYDYVVKTVEAGSVDYVRVYSDDNKLGRWLMKKSDIDGLSALEIKDKYALPEIPTHVCDVNVPASQTLNTGISAGVEAWGKGGGQQFDTGDFFLSADCFTNERIIGGE